MMDYWIYSLLCLSVCVRLGIASSNRYYLEDECGRQIDMDKAGQQSIRIRLTKFQKYHDNMECTVRVKGPSSKRLAIQFIDNLVLPSEDCQKDYVNIYDGDGVDADVIPGLPERVCETTPTADSYLSSGDHVVVRFVSDSSKASDGFHILISAFRLDPDNTCYQDEFQCKRSRRCIAESLVCDDFEDCPDSSDKCGLSIPAIIGIAVGGTVFLLAIAGIVTCYCCCNRMRSDSGSTKRLSSTSASEEPVTPTTISDDVHAENIHYYRPKSCIEPVYTLPTHSVPNGIQVETVEYYRPQSCPEPLYLIPADSKPQRASFVVHGPLNTADVYEP